jgi:hypothetical protein
MSDDNMPNGEGTEDEAAEQQEERQEERKRSIVNEFGSMVRRLGGRRIQPWKFEIPYTRSTTHGAYRGEKSLFCLTITPSGRIEEALPDEVRRIFREPDYELIQNAARKLYEFPALVPAPKDRDGRYIRPQANDIRHDSKFYYHHDINGACVFMVERRMIGGYDENRKPMKSYKPWFSTIHGWQQRWIPIDLPLFGAEFLANSGKPVMVHEGSKSALAAQIIIGRSGGKPHIHHPLYDYLSDYEHVGWHGGEQGIHHADWTALRMKDAFFFADMDQAGLKNARLAADASLQFGARSAWRSIWSDGECERNPTWDISESLRDKEIDSPHEDGRKYLPLPKLYSGDKRMSVDYMRNAFRREFVVVEKRRVTVKDKDGKPKEKEVYRLREDFVKAWAYAMAVERFYMLDNPNVNYDKPAFRSAFADRVPIGFNVALQLEHERGRISVDQPTNAPGDDRIVRESVNGENLLAVNLHMPTRIKAKEPEGRRKFSVLRPFMRLAERIAPDPMDRKMLLRWSAHVIASPGDKILWAVILISEQQGIGKTTFIKFLSKLVGSWNAVNIPVKRITESNFNEFLGRACLLNLEEMDIAGTAKDYNSLKTLITDETIQIHRKHVDSYVQPNRINIIGSSNRKLPMLLEESDRRWFPIESECKEVLPTKEAITLHEWFNNGGGAQHLLWAARIWHRHWRKLYDNPATRDAALRKFNPFNSPVNDTKKRMLEDSVPEWQALLGSVIAPVVARQKTYAAHAVKLRVQKETSEAGKDSTAANEYARMQLLAQGHTFILADIRAFLQENIKGGFVPRERVILGVLESKFAFRPAVAVMKKGKAESAPLRTPWIQARFYTAGEPLGQGKGLSLSYQATERLALLSKHYQELQQSQTSQIRGSKLSDNTPVDDDTPEDDSTGNVYPGPWSR